MADSVARSTGSWPRDPAAVWQAWLRSFNFVAPSGDVTQSFDPSLFKTMGEQLGFININAGGSGDPELERRITDQVASYGRQLGRILDALDVLIRHIDLDGLPEDDQYALDELETLRAKIEAEKERAAAASIDRLLAQVRALQRNPDANRAALQRLKDALGDG